MQIQIDNTCPIYKNKRLDNNRIKNINYNETIDNKNNRTTRYELIDINQWFHFRDQTNALQFEKKQKQNKKYKPTVN